MIYKPEHTVDLDTGALLQAEVRPGDEADAQDLSLHVLQAQENINQARAAAPDDLTIESAAADKGYHAVGEMQALQAEGIRTVISDPVKNRKLEKLDPAEAQAVRKAKRSVGSKLGKALLRRRGDAPGAQLRPCSGCRRCAANDLAGPGKLEQALQDVGRHLQPIAIDAQALWRGHA